MVVAASGPSLSRSQAEAVQRSGLPSIAVNDAYRLLPFADVLYACDERWWNHHHGVPDFKGEKWSSHSLDEKNRHNDKRQCSEKYGLMLAAGRDQVGFCFEPDVIHYGSNSGFQAVNLALQFGATRIILIGFDMGGTHFFGPHPAGLRNTNSFTNFIAAFDRAAKKLPDHITIQNATPGSALRCFKRIDLDDALSDPAGCFGADAITAAA